MATNGDTYIAVEAIIDHRDVRRGRATRRAYFVRWVGYGPEHNSYEPGETLREHELLRPDLDVYDAALTLHRSHPAAVVLEPPPGNIVFHRLHRARARRPGTHGTGEN
jgi:hypothetical protein